MDDEGDRLFAEEQARLERSSWGTSSTGDDEGGSTSSTKTDSNTEPDITTDISIIAGERTYIVFAQSQLPGGDFLFAVCVSPELGVQSLEETQYMVPAAKKKNQDLYGFIEPHASAEANLNRRSENEGRGQTCRSSKQHEVLLKTFVLKY